MDPAGTTERDLSREQTGDLQIELIDWCGWAPQLPDPAHFAAYLRGEAELAELSAKPANRDVAPRLRRRLTPVTKMVLETCLPLVQKHQPDCASTHFIFGSRNSEINILRDLLADIDREEPLSPTAFGNSVHHTATGYLSLVIKHRGISRTISANRDTFACCMLEAAMLLQQHPESRVLLMLAEELPAAPFDQMLVSPPFPFAVTLLLRAPEGRDSFLSCRVYPDQVIEPDERPPLWSWLDWWQSEQAEFWQGSGFGGMFWRR